tara:strand:- start:83 stop:463 length:381 start_codon:yes stop_codon:yes gene_type:complete
MKDLFKHVVQPVLQKQTLFQLNQLKSFVDSSLTETLAKNFENDEDKIKYLLDTLYSIRDFVLAQTTENSLRLRLMQEFHKIELEATLGNDQQQQEENSLMQTEEYSNSALLELKNEEVKIESTPNS